MTEPRILWIDIEAAPAKAYIWDLKTRYVPLKHVAEDGYVLCFAYRWNDEKEATVVSRWTRGEKAMVQKAWNLLDEADIVIHYNGNNYDIPRLNTEFLRYRMGPPSPSHPIDLFRTVRQFRVLSRSMQHMLDILGLDSKMEHKGMELWTGCMEGNAEDRQTMEEYNLQDVLVMGDLYKELRPWIKDHPNMSLYMDLDKKSCPKCGSEDLRFKGYKRTKVMNYKQYKCNSCGSYPRERYADKADQPEGVLTW